MKYRFCLYVTGRSSPSQRAIANLQEICEHRLRGKAHVEVIDVLEQPELANAKKILATPTLVRQFPGPVRKIVGDLADWEKVLRGLDISPDAAQSRRSGVK